jgi:hypothetical protein
MYNSFAMEPLVKQMHMKIDILHVAQSFVKYETSKIDSRSNSSFYSTTPQRTNKSCNCANREIYQNSLQTMILKSSWQRSHNKKAHLDGHNCNIPTVVHSQLTCSKFLDSRAILADFGSR